MPTTTRRWAIAVELDSIRTVVAAAGHGQFQSAADDLGISAQAVSKRIATLERHLGVALFVRTPHGVRLTPEGQAFLPHAHEMLRVADRARRSVQIDGRVMRVDITHHRTAPSVVFHDFHVAHADLNVDVVTLPDNHLTGALAAVQTGDVDASFRAVPVPAADLPSGVTSARAFDSALELLVGPNHPLAAETSVAPDRLARYRIWIPGIVADTEWATFYDDFAAEFEVTIDSRGPHFGDEALMDQLRDSPDVATVVGERDRYFWPAHYRLRRVPLRNPTPVYPHSLIWPTANPHPGLAALRSYLAAVHRTRTHEPDVWVPAWAHRCGGLAFRHVDVATDQAVPFSCR